LNGNVKFYEEENHSSTRRVPASSAKRRSARDRQPNRFLFIEIVLRKMYLVSAETFSIQARNNHQLLFEPKKTAHPPPSKKKNKKRKLEKQHLNDIQGKFRNKMEDIDITRKTHMKAIADILQKVLPELASPRTETVVKKKKKQPPPPPYNPIQRYWRRLSRGSHSEKSVTTTTTIMMVMIIMFLSREMHGRSVGRMSAPQPVRTYCHIYTKAAAKTTLDTVSEKTLTRSS